MASQKSYYGKLVQPEIGAGRLVVQCGYAKFLKKAKTVSITTKVKTVKAMKLKYRTGAAAKSLSAMLYCSGTVSGGKLIISRSTLGGTMSGASFYYEVIGVP